MMMILETMLGIPPELIDVGRGDKGARFTDWSRRPLTQKQLEYALADVVHLRPVYEELARRLEASGRAEWLEEEMATLADPATYRLDPGGNRRFFAVLKEIAAWREREAQKRDIPRNRILRDESLLDVAAHAPQNESTIVDLTIDASVTSCRIVRPRAAAALRSAGERVRPNRSVIARTRTAAAARRGNA